MNNDPDSFGFRRTKLITFDGYLNKLKISKQKKYNDLSFDVYKHGISKIFSKYSSKVRNKNCNNFIAIFDDYFSNNHTSHLPILSKSRLLIHKYGILWDFNHERHWGKTLDVDYLDIDWKYKTNRVIWRGCMWTGWETRNNTDRLTFVNQYFNNTETYNIAFSDKKAKRNREHTDIDVINDVRYKNNLKYQKKKVTIRKQLKYKFIVSIEGNDVASGLSWQLYSNSVVLMPLPTCETWLMHGKLIPFKHYIPLIYNNDKWDLDEKYKWCLENDKKCNQIAQNGKKWVKQFLNKRKENYVKQQIITRYCNNIKFV